MMFRIAHAVWVVLAVAALCGFFLISSMHASPTPERAVKGKSTTSLPADIRSDFQLPPGYTAPQELLVEYETLVRDVSALSATVRRVERRLSEEALPPDLAGIPRVYGGAHDAKPVAVKADTVDTDSIFVSVASFRDEECSKTIQDMYAKAKNPTRLYIGAIQQNDPTDLNMECMPEEFMKGCAKSEFCPRDNIRIRKVLAKDAKGPTFGRYVAMLMYNGEKYFMMIDSHNRFIHHWDSALIHMYRSTPSKKAVLSHYPSSWNGEGHNFGLVNHVTVMCNGHYLDGFGFIRMDGSVMERSAVPRLQPFSAAGFLFADAQLVHEVPFDPYLDFLFDGEEILYSARMWTHGWDLYAPSSGILFHYYIRSNAPRVWSVPGNNWWHEQQISNKRVQMFLKATKTNTTELLVDPADTAALDKLPKQHRKRLLAEMTRYGLGKERSLDDYWKFAMVDPIHRKTTHAFCDKARQAGK